MSGGKTTWAGAQEAEMRYWMRRREECVRASELLGYLAGLGAALAPAAGEIRACKPERCLEIGVGPPGFGSLVFHLPDTARITGVDPLPALRFESEDADVSRLASALAARVDYRQSRAEDLPFEDASFDLVGCHNVIDHCERPDAVLREAVRVLKPGAPLVITLNTFSRVGRLKFECNRRLHPRDELFVEHPWSYTSESFEHLALGFGLVTRKAWGARVTWLGRSGLSGFVFSKPAKA